MPLKPNAFQIEPKIFNLPEVFFGSDRKTDSAFLLGQIDETGRGEFAWMDSSKEHVVAIIGKRGSGKSHTLGVLAESFAVNNEKIVLKGKKRRAAVLLDTLGIYWTTKYPLKESQNAEIQRQYQEMKKWNLGISERPNVEVFVPRGYRTSGDPEGSNEFSISVKDITPDDWSFLLKLDLFEDPMGQLLHFAYTKIVEDGWHDTRTNTARPANPDYNLQSFIDCIQYDQELTSDISGFKKETRRGLVAKLNHIQKTLPVFSENGTSLETLLQTDKLSVLLIYNLPDDVRTVISSILFRKILDARKKESLAAKRKLVGEYPEYEQKIPPVWVMIDEAQNISPSESRLGSSETLVKMIREGRNFGISVAITTQQPTALDERVMAQVDTLIVHKLTVKKDIDAVNNNSKAAHPSSIVLNKQPLNFDDLIRRLPVGEALISNPEVEREFIVKIRPRVTVHGGFEI